MHLAMAMFYLWLQNKLFGKTFVTVLAGWIYSKNGPVQNMQIMLKETPSSKENFKVSLVKKLVKNGWSSVKTTTLQLLRFTTLKQLPMILNSNIAYRSIQSML